MREHVQPRDHRPLRLWLGLILLASVPSVVLAQGQRAANDRTTQEPIDLAARRILVWNGDGERWVALSGDASVSQGAAGLRARGAVIRITELPENQGHGFQAEIYAEGDVQISGQTGPPRADLRAMLRTAKSVMVKPQDAKALTTLKEPPRGLPILQHSGFIVNQAPEQVAAAKSPSPRDVQEPADASSDSAADAMPNLEPVAEQAAASPNAPRRDPQIQRTRQDAGNPVETQDRVRQEMADEDDEPPDVDLPPIEGAEDPVVPRLDDFNDAPDGDPLEEQEPRPEPLGDEPEILGPAPSPESRLEPAPPGTPILSGTQRVTSIWPRSGRKVDTQLREEPDGTLVVVYRGGINLVVTSPKFGTIDAEAESLVVWKHPDPKKTEIVPGPDGEPIERPIRREMKGPNGELIEDPNQPMEIYLEGNVILRQDENRYAGKGDQRTFRAQRAYYDVLTDRVVAFDAEVDVFAPGLIAPMKLKSPRIEQFHKLLQRPDGMMILDPNPEIRAEKTMMTGSRFPKPAYQINNRSVDLTRRSRPATDPNSGRVLTDPNDPDAPTDLLWRYDARQNVFWMGWLPIFYWPRMTGDVDEIDPPLRQIAFRSNNYLGQQVLSDWNGFKVFGIKKPDWIDIWNLDLDYLSRRTQDFPALGSEMGWFGRDLVRDLTDPYHRERSPGQNFTHDYYGYFDIWGLKDSANDVLGSGPAIITNGPLGAGRRGFQRDDSPPFQDIRGRFNIRHMQRFLPDDDEHRFEDLRLQLEVAYVSDRQFLEEYYKRLNETGMDQETLGYMQWQKNNWSWDLWAEANLQNFNTDTQWLPRLDYYRLGDSFLDNWVTHYQHSGVDYANTHTDVMVNNPNLFAFMPYDPVTNTSGPFQSLRGYTSHELDLPLNIYDVVRVVPYVQGQVVGWSDQIGGGPFNQQSTGAMGRIWGAAGARSEMTIWKLYPNAESEIFNVHGLNNKMSFYSDFRTSYANQSLDSIAVRDDLDMNTYEYVRRYFAITSWTGGLLPVNYDPRQLMLRRSLSPITGSTDVQASMTTLQLGLHQRLQTKRGPEGRRRVVDWMTLDLNGTYYPDAVSDNFGKPWGQTMYNYQWFLGDRTSFISTGWFDFWDITGSKPLDNNMVQTFNPKGLNVITTGISMSRPPRTNIFIGYTVINSGPIDTSALNASLSYWLSPKWYGTFSTSYDFGNKVPLGSMFSLTRIGADYLVSLGLSVDPQRQSYMFAAQISPRLSPNLRLGSGVGMNQFDSRYAPTQ